MRFFFANAIGSWRWDDPDTRGIGNSETAQIEMTRILASRGHSVTSFAPLKGRGQKVKGVRWLPIRDVKLYFDLPGVWVVSRSPNLLDLLPPMKGRRVWFVSQDVEYGEALTPERQSRIDRILALCPVHADYLRERYPALKVNVSSNGARVDLIERIEHEQAMPGMSGGGGRKADGGPLRQPGEADLLLPQVPAVRNPFRIAYTSSPDRGLTPLLHVFKRAREFEPRLELAVCYGFHNLQKQMPKQAEALRKQLDAPGVTHHGRMPQPELYRLLSTCGMWCYPTDFTETGCASHLEAMCLGCVPVFSPLWAMEHNGGAGLPIEGGAGDPLTRARFVRAILRLAWEPALAEAIRWQMVPWARRQFSWERVADQYEMMAHEPPERKVA